MRTIATSSYEKLLGYHTTKRIRRDKPPVIKERCECGKMTSVNIMERHKDSKLHKRLCRLKAVYEQSVGNNPTLDLKESEVNSKE